MGKGQPFLLKHFKRIVLPECQCAYGSLGHQDADSVLALRGGTWALHFSGLPGAAAAGT